ncbi:MAG: fibronectin type III domain-containing protein, partial [Acidobacteriaceae bacterium]|nr:fibronectin type III domain-containing protein [Acidobacteriaceae bacterium]
DPERAAFFFIGTPTGGNLQATGVFPGIWHAYIASTYDGGAHYYLVDTTPNDPVQVGSICIGGTTCGADRNLLDFNDLSIDAQGRVIGAFADGCVVGSCDASSPDTASRSALGTIVRQSGGKRMFAEFDPKEPEVPAAPQIGTALQGVNGVLLTWLAPDNGGSPVTEYVVYRGTTSGSEKPIATVSSTKTAFLDQAAKKGTFYYRVAAMNKYGTGPLCGEVKIAPTPIPQSACNEPGITVVSDPSGDQTGAPANAELDIQSISIAEPYDSGVPAALTFTMKVANLSTAVQPNSSWTIFFTAPNGTQYFVDMNTDGTSTTPVFQYGHTTTLATGTTQQNTDGTAEASSKYTSDGTITIVVPDSVIGGLKAGDQLVNVNGKTQLEVGAAGTGLLETIDSTVAGRYILVGNASCRGKTTPGAN